MSCRCRRPRRAAEGRRAGRRPAPARWSARGSREPPRTAGPFRIGGPLRTAGPIRTAWPVRAAARKRGSSLAATDRGIHAAAVPEPTGARASLERARARLRGGRAGGGDGLLDELLQLGVLARVAAHAVELEPGVLLERAARAQVAAGERLVETTRDVRRG